MARLKFIVAYEGTGYAGWQVQDETRQAQPTVQAVLEQALASVLKAPVRVHGASRTDSGVHAEMQVAHCDVPEEKLGVNWVRALNTHLPGDVRVLSAQAVSSDFHSRKMALAKVYTYCLWPSHAPLPPRLRNFCWKTKPLNLEAMRSAAEIFIGEHDFQSFQNTGTHIKSTVRTVYSVDFCQGLAGPLVCPAEWPVLSVRFHGNGFLKQMIRNLVGALVQAGLGKVSPGDVAAILKAANREQNPCPTAPAQGLTLMRIFYE